MIIYNFQLYKLFTGINKYIYFNTIISHKCASMYVIFGYLSCYAAPLIII